jgi:hypothetical protein
MLILTRSLVFATVKGMGALALGGAILWQVAERAGVGQGVAYIHVYTADVDVTVDEMSYHVNSLWETPIVCELGPGRHVVRMFRHGQALFEEEFTLGLGQEIVVCASERPVEKRAVAASSSRPISHSELPTRLARRNH